MDRKTYLMLLHSVFSSTGKGHCSGSSYSLGPDDGDQLNRPLCFHCIDPKLAYPIDGAAGKKLFLLILKYIWVQNQNQIVMHRILKNANMGKTWFFIV